MRVDPTSQIPVFKQIADYLSSSIAAGVYQPDEALPSKRALGMKLGVNPHTVQHAYAQLEQAGLVYARKGVGMFVASRGVGRAQTKSEKACYESLVLALKLARDAGLSDRRIRGLVGRALKAKHQKTRS